MTDALQQIEMTATAMTCPRRSGCCCGCCAARWPTSRPGYLDEIAALVPGEVTIRRVPDLIHLLGRDPAPASLWHYRRLLRGPVDPDLLEEVAGRLAAHLR